MPPGQQHLKSAEKDIKKAQRIQSGGKALFLDTDPAAKVSILAERQSSFTQVIQVERGHIFTGPGAILVKDNIQTPVQLILYGPMLAYRLGKMSTSVMEERKYLVSVVVLPPLLIVAVTIPAACSPSHSARCGSQDRSVSKR